MGEVYSAVVGVGGHLPERRISNDALRQWVDTTDDWVRERTGIRHRHLAAPGELASDLALPAAQKALAQAEINASDLDAIIFATTTPDRIYPASACFSSVVCVCKLLFYLIKSVFGFARAASAPFNFTRRAFAAPQNKSAFPAADGSAPIRKLRHHRQRRIALAFVNASAAQGFADFQCGNPIRFCRIHIAEPQGVENKPNNCYAATPINHGALVRTPEVCDKRTPQNGNRQSRNNGKL